MGRKACFGQVEIFGLFTEGKVAVVDVQIVVMVVAFHISGVAYINIQISVAIHINHHHAG